MTIYARDYRKLTDVESEEYEKCLKREKVVSIDGLDVRRNLLRKYPKAARHFQQVFPNNYLDFVDLQDKQRLSRKVDKLEEVLDNDACIERDVVRYIRESCSYFAIASVLHRYYNFGHHATHIFPEFSLGTSFRADYLLVGQNSSGWHLVFVELESVYGRITKACGNFGESIRNGVEQVEDWSNWLDRNYSILRDEFVKHLAYNKQLPDELTQYDSTRIHYLVVAGRRKDYAESTYRKGRILERGQKIGVVHYDNILDTARYIIGRDTF